MESGDQAGCPSLKRNVRVMSVSGSSTPSFRPSTSFITTRLLLPNWTDLNAIFVPSGDHVGWPSSGRRNVFRSGVSTSSGET